MATLFGPVHGFGLAAVLSEVGLPRHEIATALLFFNVGVEIGQVLSSATVLALFRTLSRRPAFRLARTQQVMIYGVGSLAALWTLQRIASF